MPSPSPQHQIALCLYAQKVPVCPHLATEGSDSAIPVLAICLQCNNKYGPDLCLCCHKCSNTCLVNNNTRVSLCRPPDVHAGCSAVMMWGLACVGQQTHTNAWHATETPMHASTGAILCPCKPVDLPLKPVDKLRCLSIKHAQQAQQSPPCDTGGNTDQRCSRCNTCKAATTIN